MKIQISDNVPDGTYFTSSDVAPVIKGNALIVYNGKGSRRSWGAPTTTSSVVVNTATFTAVHVGFHHKHRGGQQWYYFVEGERQTWAQLSDRRKRQVLNSLNKAPGWANIPGVLKRELPAKKIAYKLVRLDGDRMLSLYDGETEYQIGKRLAQKAQPRHNGGYYAYPTAEGCKELWQHGKLVAITANVSRLALLEVEISGTVVEYGGKLAATYIRPVRVVEIIEVA